MGWDKCNLVDKAETMHTKQSKTRHLFTTSNGQTAVQPFMLKIRASWYLAVIWEGKHYHPVCPFLPSSPALHSQYDVLWYGMSLWWAGISSPRNVPFHLHEHPQPPSLVEHYEEQKMPWFCVNTAQQQLKHWCVHYRSGAFSSNPKHSPMPATLKKITLSQSKPGQTLMNALILLRTPLAHTNEIHSIIQLSAARKLQTWNIDLYSEQSPSSKIRQLSENVRASAGGNRKRRLSHSPKNWQSNKNPGKNSTSTYKSWCICSSFQYCLLWIL